jgi:hypothetical protein
MDFAIYVDRVRLRRFVVAVYEIRDHTEELFRDRLTVRCWTRRGALRSGQRAADAYYRDQTKQRQTLAMLVLPQPAQQVRFVADDSPENRR